MVTVSIILLKAGNFMGVSKCCLIPEQLVSYLGIDCDSNYGRFLVPRERMDKYIPVLQGFLSKQWISFAEQIREEWSTWIFFLSQNTGSPWKSLNNVFLQADIASDASGRAFAGVVDFPLGKLTSQQRNFREIF